jgi:hypothetical protein
VNDKLLAAPIVLQPGDLALDQRDALLAEQLFLLGQHDAVALEFGAVSVELDARKEDVKSPVSRALAGWDATHEPMSSTTSGSYRVSKRAMAETASEATEVHIVA